MKCAITYLFLVVVSFLVGAGIGMVLREVTETKTDYVSSKNLSKDFQEFVKGQQFKQVTRELQ